MKTKYIAYFLLLLIAFIFSVGGVLGKDSQLPSYAVIITIIISIIYFFRTVINFYKEMLFYKVWTIFLIVNIVGFFLTETMDKVYGPSMFKNILIVFFPFYPFYYFSKKNILNTRMLIVFLLVMLPIVILRFFNERFIILADTNSEDVVNNVAYVFVALIPYVFLFGNKRVLPIITLSLLFFFIVIGSKRGAMITASLGILSYVYLLYKKIKQKNKIKSLFFILTTLIIFTNIINSFLISNKFLVSRFQTIASDGGSGRDVIFLDLWEAWLNSESYFNTFFGFGFASTMSLNRMGLFAHNDWLEMLINFGLFGVILYFLIFYSLFKGSSKLKREPKYILRTIILMLFLISSFSMFYCVFDNILYIIFIAYMIGAPHLKKSNNENKLFY
jgi:hypothetical protein